MILVACSSSGSPRHDEILVNPLTTDDAFWRCQILVVCYQLVQSVLKIGSALAERVGQGGTGWGRGRWVGALLWLTVHGGSCGCL